MPLTGDHVVNDTGHTDDHNLIDDAIGAVQASVTAEATSRTNGDNAAVTTAAADATSKANAAQAAAVQRANHTGTQLAATISDFSAAAVAATGGTYAPISATWVTGTVYKTGELVTNGTSLYKAVDNHTAGATFAGDSAHWTLLGGAVTSVNGQTGAVVTSAGIRKRGYSIPKGSLDVWDAARAASATAHRDVVLFGDSTTEGVPPSGSNTGGWVAKLRALSIAAGVTDGGRGIIGGTSDDASFSGESLAGFVSRTGWAASAQFSAPGPLPFNSTAVGNVLTLQYKTPSNALRIRSTSNSGVGRLTVKDGVGATIGTFDPYVFGQTYGEKTKVFTGLAAGGSGQTVTITNTGGAPIITPSAFRTGSNTTTGGALTPGGYTWVMTAVDGSGGETNSSNAISATIPAGTSTNQYSTAIDTTQTGVTKWNLYRAAGTGVTARTSFFFVKQVTSSGSGGQVVLNDLGETPTAQNPPAANGAGVSDPANGGPAGACITVEFFDSTKGITYHRAGYTNQRYPLLFSPSNSTVALAAYDTQTHLGLTPGLGANGLDWSSPPAAAPDARTVALAACAFGINDLNQMTSLTSDLQAVTNGVAQFIRLARSAGADPLVIIPHLEYAADTADAPNIGVFRAAILNTADAHGCAWVDFNEALGPVTAARLAAYSGVHLTQAGYDAEAQFLWDNVLSGSALR